MPESVYPTAFVEQFNANVQFLAAQKRHAFAGLVRVESQKGETEYFDQIGEIRAKRRVAKKSDVTYMEPQYFRRGVTTAPWDIPVLIDRPDQVRGIIDPTSIHAQNMAYGMNVAKDEIIIEAALGPAFEKPTLDAPPKRIDLPAAQKIAVDFGSTGTNSGLTLKKVIRIKHLLSLKELEPGAELIFVHTQQQLTDLLNNVEQVQSADYNSVKALVDGKVDFQADRYGVPCNPHT